MSKNLERLLAILKAEANVVESINKGMPFRYKSKQRLILDRGKPFLTKVEPHSLRGELKQCFQNCFEALLIYPDLSYCEGFANDDNTLIAVSHAWLVNETGEVIDPTWKSKRFINCTYFGVVFNTDFVMEMAEKTLHYGILDTDYLNGHQLLKKGFPRNALHAKFHP